MITLGKRKILSLGANVDRQENYLAYGADAFLDLPVRGRDALTLQASFLRYDGGRTFC